MDEKKRYGAEENGKWGAFPGNLPMTWQAPHKDACSYVLRTVKKEELTRGLFGEFRRHQVVEDVFRRKEGHWMIRQEPFVDEWSQEDYEFLVGCLKDTLDKGGVVLGVFAEGVLKGFASVDGEPMGSQGQYLDLTSLHVSEELRGIGIGRKLFGLAALWAKERGARKLYISSHSAVETQRFYEAMGCVDAAEPSAKHMMQEPCDRQLELDLTIWEQTGGRPEEGSKA